LHWGNVLYGNILTAMCNLHTRKTIEYKYKLMTNKIVFNKDKRVLVPRAPNNGVVVIECLEVTAQLVRGPELRGAAGRRQHSVWHGRHCYQHQCYQKQDWHHACVHSETVKNKGHCNICYVKTNSVGKRSTPWAWGGWFDLRPRYTKDVIQVVPGASLPIAQHVRIGLASFFFYTSFKI